MEHKLKHAHTAPHHCLVAAQFFTEIALPGLFAAIDLLLCVIDFLTPSGWNDQLRCVEERCFRGPNIVTDMLVFTHLPVVLHRFTAIMEATLNSRTGKRFFGKPGASAFSAKSRTLDPETGEPIERTETESASMGNPMYEFNFADSFKELLPTMGAEQCGGCFNCKWPELRLVWLLTASIGSLFSEQNVDGYRGNVTAHCLANGSWYAQACGPMGAELLPYRTWLAKGYTAGFVEIDARIFDSYAATIVKRSREMGASSDDFFPELVQAARNWESVGRSAAQMLEATRTGSGYVEPDEAAKAAPFVYHVCRNHRHEASLRNLDYDMPHAFYDLAGGSIERITGQFLWDQYAPHLKTSPHTHTRVHTHHKQYLPPLTQSLRTIGFHSSPWISCWSSSMYRNSTRLPPTPPTVLAFELGLHTPVTSDARSIPKRVAAS